MALKARDGSMHTNAMTMNQANARFDVKKPDKPPKMNDQPDMGPKDIQSDPVAMDLVNQLQQMGYTGEDVEKAMGGDMDDQPQMSAPSGGGNAPINLPGL